MSRSIIEKLHEIEELCTRGTDIVYDINVRDLFVRISANVRILEIMIETHFEVYHSLEEVGEAFLDNVNKELGLEDEIAYEIWKAKNDSSEENVKVG